MSGGFWEENGIRLYDILDRVSCWCCKNKNRKELKAIGSNINRIARSVNAGIARAEDAKLGLFLLDRIRSTS